MTSARTLMPNIEPLSKVPRILVEEDADPVLLIFKRQMFRLASDEQILATNPGCR